MCDCVADVKDGGLVSFTVQQYVVPNRHAFRQDEEVLSFILFLSMRNPMPDDR